MESPASRQLSMEVVLPTDWTAMVTVPASGLEDLMVRGMRSPLSCRRRMMNCPGRCLRAIRGASMTNCLILSPTVRASKILYMSVRLQFEERGGRYGYMAISRRKIRVQVSGEILVFQHHYFG